MTPAEAHRHRDDTQRLYLHVHDKQALRLTTLAGTALTPKSTWVVGRN